MLQLAKRHALIALAIVGANASLAQPTSGSTRLNVTLGSDYKLHGLTQTSSDPAARISADYDHNSGFFAGGFVTNVDYAAESAFRTPRDLQANLYAGFGWRRPDWRVNLSVSRYIYPGIDFRYDYTQAAVNFSFRDRYFVSVSNSNNYLSISQKTYQYKVGTAQPWIWDLEIGINAGRFHSRSPFGMSYSFWDAGISRPIGRFALDLRYHDSTFNYQTIWGETGSDRWVFSMTYSILPRRLTTAN